MKKDDKQVGKFNLLEKILERFFPHQYKKNPREPFNLVVLIPRFFCGISLMVLLWGLFHVYSNRDKVFEETLEQERIKLDKEISVNGDVNIPDKRFLKTIWARQEKTGDKKFLLWELFTDFYANIKKENPGNEKYKNIEILSCKKVSEKEKEKLTDDQINKANAWCSLIGIKKEALSSKGYVRKIVNRNDAIPRRDSNKGIIYDENDEPIYKFPDEGNKELFALPPYSFWEGIQKFPDTKISKNGEYTLSIYPSIQEGMSKFMSDNNMTGSVFAYRPSNGDIYCMASTPGWTERENKMPKDGSEINKNFRSFTPGSTMKPISLLLLKVQGKNLQEPIQVPTDDDKHRDKNWNYNSSRDSYFVKVDMKEDGSGPKEGEKIRAVHCTLDHSKTANGSSPKQSAVDGLGNSCNSYFAMRAEELDLEKAKETLEAMDFYVEKYGYDKEHQDPKIREHARLIDKIRYNQNELPLEVNPSKKETQTLWHSRPNVENFVGESNLLVSPIDMAVWTALFGKLSPTSDNENEEKKEARKNSKVYFPRLWLPVDQKEQNEGSPELLLTEKNSTENEHIAKLSKFVSEHKNDIADVGEIWKDAFGKYYRKRNEKWPSPRKHLDKGSPFDDWSQWIDMAKTGTFSGLSDKTNPNFGKCISGNSRINNCTKRNKAETRTQRTLSIYSEELDLAAYIVIENYSGMYSDESDKPTKNNSKTKLDSTSLVLMNLVADALGKELDSVRPSSSEKSKKVKEKDQIKILKSRYTTTGINLKLIDEVNSNI